ncbi:MAG: hypothetical protein JWQ35_361 [Bacteriovoracaceae bacterium]|nr:hypothetical protein [Bacteriovoracaceae bacterium]
MKKYSFVLLGLLLNSAGVSVYAHDNIIVSLDYDCVVKKVPTNVFNLTAFDPRLLGGCSHSVDIDAIAKKISDKFIKEVKDSLSTTYLKMLLQNDAAFQDQRQRLETILEDMRRVVPDSAQSMSKTKDPASSK